MAGISGGLLTGRGQRRQLPRKCRAAKRRWAKPWPDVGAFSICAGTTPACVSALMDLCDKLQILLNVSHTLSLQALQSIQHHALAPPRRIGEKCKDRFAN